MPTALLSLPRLLPSVAGHSGAPCASERGAKVLLDWNPYTACTEDQLASIDRPSLFIRKRINKRCGETVYGARSDDKIGPCKSAGYLTGRRTIFEYLPARPRSPRRAAESLRSPAPARVLQPSLCTGSSLLLHARRTIFLFALFFAFQGTAGSVPTNSPTPSCLKITKLGHG